jgi:serine/threonine/tyrosine-interacting protein
MEPNLGPGAASGALRAAPFSSRPPSPPYIHVPVFMGDGGMGSAYLSKGALEIITRGKEQIATNTTTLWSYDNRRAAQKILDFLYLGPASVCRDLDFLRDAGITMILACRDVAFPGGFQSVEKAAAALGITADVLDVDGKYGLPQAFPKAVQKINDHLLSFYRNQAVAGSGAEHHPEGLAVGNGSFRQGKVLVCCETGNDRSAAIVVAYIMSIFDMGMVKAAQFVGLQRFCCNFDDDVKHVLTAYEDIVGAMQDVKAQSDAADKLMLAGTSAEEQWAASSAQISSQKPGLVGSMEVDLAVSKGTKRRLDETVDSDMADADTVDSGDSDAAGRSFAPFTD